MGVEAFADYQMAIHDPHVVHGMIEDYRAGISIDHLHDAADRDARRQIECPTMVLWSLHDDLESLYGDVLGVWRPWIASSLAGKRLPCGHDMAEEIPAILATEIASFMKMECH